MLFATLKFAYWPIVLRYIGSQTKKIEITETAPPHSKNEQNRITNENP